jgi:hypothetical protein
MILLLCGLRYFVVIGSPAMYEYEGYPDLNIFLMQSPMPLEMFYRHPLLGDIVVVPET